MLERISFNQEEIDFVSAELRQEWGILSAYERWGKLKMLFEAKQSKGSSKKTIIRDLARALNQNEDNIVLHLGIGRFRQEIRDLLRREVTDLDVAYKIQKILDERNNIPENTLFKRLRQITDEKNEEAENITISVFYEILQEFLLDSSKDWRDRMTLCQIHPKWKREGEAFKDHKLIYIPTDFLIDRQKKLFHIHPNEAFIMVETGSGMRPTKVPMEAIEPHDFYIDRKNDLYDQLTQWRNKELYLDLTEIAEILKQLTELERKSNVTTKNKGREIVAKNSFMSEKWVNYYLSLLKLNGSLQQRVNKKTMTVEAATEFVQTRREHKEEIDFDKIEKQLLRIRTKIMVRDVRKLVTKALKSSSSDQPISENPDYRDQLS